MPLSGEGTDKRIVCFGECMIELSRLPGEEAWRMGFAGDTVNVAVYCARAGVGVSYMTALGTDPYSLEMRAFLEAEGVDCGLALEHPSRVAGLYAIETDTAGERSFTYWRERSAARAFFDIPGVAQALSAAERADMLYLSGITLSLFDEAQRAQIVDLARRVRQRGGEVAFDGNYRARGWGSAEAARSAFRQIAPYCSIVLPTFDDEVALFEDHDPHQTIARWQDAGAWIVAVKLGEQGAILATKGKTPLTVTPEQPCEPRDTTGAGDSFNAAFLTGLLRADDPVTAAQAANRLAGKVIMHPGAIIPRAECAA